MDNVACAWLRAKFQLKVVIISELKKYVQVQIHVLILRKNNFLSGKNSGVAKLEEIFVQKFCKLAIMMLSKAMNSIKISSNEVMEI